MKNSTNIGDIVLDPFVGSGTTAMLKNLNRKYIGFELDKTYFDIAQKRIQDAQTLFSMDRVQGHGAVKPAHTFKKAQLAPDLSQYDFLKFKL